MAMMPYASLSPAGGGGGDTHYSTATASLLPFCRGSPVPLSLGDGVGLGEDAPDMSKRWAAAIPLPFTPAQYKELEQQALIYKYLAAGVPVPSNLVVPIRRGLDSLATRLHGHHTVAYIGRKLDLEPGRCRRTDGKKWRCAKVCGPDSKYCDRHMNRKNRNRSRKPVETQPARQASQPPSSPMPPIAAQPLAAVTNGANFLSHSFYPGVAGSNGGGGSNNYSSPFSSSLSSSQLDLDCADTYSFFGGGNAKDLRYTGYGISYLADNQLISDAIIDSSMENQWRLAPSTNSFPLPSYTQLGALSYLGQSTVSSLSKMDRQPVCFLETDFVKPENQLLPFFDEWPKSRDSWEDLGDENTNLASFPATQLSMSIPMASPDFSAASSQSPNDD